MAIELMNVVLPYHRALSQRLISKVTFILSISYIPWYRKFMGIVMTAIYTREFSMHLTTS